MADIRYHVGLNQGFERFLGTIRPTKAELNRAVERTEYATRVLSNDPEFGLDKILYSGSFAKQTALVGLSDVDVVLYLDEDNWVNSKSELYMPSTLLRKLYDRLEIMFRAQVQLRRNNRSVSILFADGFKVDLVPALWDGNKGMIGRVPDRNAQGWVRTCVPRHIKFIQRRGDGVRDAIRLAKVWKNDWSINRFGFALELLTCKAWDLQSGLPSPRTAFKRMIELIIATKLREPIIFDDYYQRSSVRLPHRPIIIVDPANPSNNVASSLDAADRDRIVDKAYETLHWIERADDRLEAGDVGMSSRWWNNVFSGLSND
jgi:tRNA nucleotidyltransferase (CCA-adding enzyme)